MADPFDDDRLDAVRDRLVAGNPSRLPDRAVFTVRETSAILGVGRGLAYEICRAGLAIRIGRRLVVPRARLERLLSGGTVDQP